MRHARQQRPAQLRRLRDRTKSSAGNFNAHGEFVDIVKHTPGQTQTETQASSVDPWHTAEDRVSSRMQTGFDLFFTSGYTNHLPAMIPIAMLYARRRMRRGNRLH